ncbi:MAG: glycosyltransferase [Planctomycetales bacterium]|nr:glycosyltransferase [Planctomycetales bacterium]MBN8626858.1 glycosyltransferase [Planctomycetota bacterium]
MFSQARKLISVVTPCYNEEPNLVDCRNAVRTLFTERLPEYDYEHIFCDNCSTDQSPMILREMAKEDARIKVIYNARNFGPFRSNFNGVLSTSGDAVVVSLAADLQDPPEVIYDFVRKWEQGFEVVHGVRANRQENIVMRNVRRVYYRLVSRFANIQIPDDVGEFQLVDRVVVEALREFDDYYPYIRGMIASCGFRSVGVPFTWKRREKGLSKNRLYGLIDQGLNGLISFTNLPMRLCLFLGTTIAVLSVLYALGIVVTTLIFQTAAPPGVTTVMTALFFFSGVMLFFLGVLGEYISAIHFQVRKRPLVTERGRLNFVQKPPIAEQIAAPQSSSAPEHSS